MSPKFGTSGLRGLVVDLTDALVWRYTAAFLTRLAPPGGGPVLVGMDLRPSSARIAAVCCAAATAQGLDCEFCGVLPTPALALAAQTRGAAAIMVTGSHIPADRNGLKFYTPLGEITKADETAILNALPPAPTGLSAHPLPPTNTAPLAAYVRRYTDGFAAGLLAGARIGVYQHSTAARDLLVEVLGGLGADTIPLGWSDRFIPVDTEALDPGTAAVLAGWAGEHRLDAIVSADGDADRPMLAGADGVVLAGDQLGQITARYLRARRVVTPVSSNSGVDLMPEFDRVIRTAIGSPHVIAGMTAGGDRVVGYEANGGFLLGFAATPPGGTPLAPLATRDAMLPLICALADARARACRVEDLPHTLPRRATAADRLTDTPAQASAAFLALLAEEGPVRTGLLDGFAPVATIDRTDGLRMTLADGQIVHLRPSGNAPEFRVYTEADTPDQARALLAQMLTRVRAALSGAPGDSR